MPEQLPIQDATIFKPEIAWTTVAKNVQMVSAWIYRVSVTPSDVNELGAELAVKEIGFFLRDFIGSTYRVTAINVGGDTTVIEIEDILKTGYGPQSGQPAIIYKSVGEGTAPFIAPIRTDLLDQSARDQAAMLELDALWKGQPASKFVFTGSNVPSITAYNTKYKDIYGQYPEVRLFTYNDGKEWERMEKPEFQRSGDPILLQGIQYDLSDLETGFLILAKA